MKRHTVILGAGISGLALGYFLTKHGQRVTVVEKAKRVGGHGSSFSRGGFTLDYGPHKLYSQLPGIMEFFADILGEDTLKVKKRNSLYLLGKYFRFPLHLPNLLSNISPRTVLGGLRVGFGALPTFFRSNADADNFEDYFIRGFGKPGYELIFKGYAQKVWGHPRELSADLAKKRVPVSSIPHFLTHLFSSKEKSKVSADHFYYPKRGLVTLSEKLADFITSHGGSVLLDEKVTGLSCSHGRVREVRTSRRALEADTVVSTLHLHDLAEMLEASLPSEAQTAVSGLRHSSLKLCFIFLDKKRAMRDAWVFFPSADIIFNRISEQKAFSPFTCPEDKTVLCAEITIPPGSELEHWSKEQFIKRVIHDLVKVALIKEKEVFDSLVIGEHRIYPVYDKASAHNLSTALKGIHSIPNLLTIGRPGLFNYNNMDHCVDMAFAVGQALLDGTEKSGWKELERRFDAYRIVD